MKFSHLIVYLMLPIFTMCSNNTYSSNNYSIESISGPTRIENSAIKNILGQGFKIPYDRTISGEKQDGTFTAYFAPKTGVSGNIEVYNWDTWKKGDGEKIKVLVENGKFSVYDKDNAKYRTSEFEYDKQQYKYGIIEHKTPVTHKQQYKNGYRLKHSTKTKYYLAAYSIEDNCTIWWLLDNDKDLNAVGIIYNQSPQ